MFKVTVLKMKDIIKISVGIIVTIIMVIVLSKNFKIGTAVKNKLSSLQSNIKSAINFKGIDCINEAVPTIGNINQEYKEISKDEENKEEKNVLHEILNTQISSIQRVTEDNIEEQNKIESNEESDDKNQENTTAKTQEKNKTEENNSEEMQLAQTGLGTQVITNNPIKDSSNIQYGNIKIKNETSYELTNEILNPDIKIDNKNIIIFHTHSCESYTSSEKYPYVETGNYRTTDLDYTVTRVGTELENQLKKYNRNVVHSVDYHDYPTYNGSYTRSLTTVEKLLEKTPSDIIIDLHRDAIGSRSDYAPTVKIGDTDEAAQIMFVIGTDEGGLWHPNWQQNLKFAVKVQQKAEEMYPGLFKTMMVTKSRYNQHTGKYANIMEVGATGNTLEQCLTSMKYLAKVLDEVLK